jgi:WD40 repeat protein
MAEIERLRVGQSSRAEVHQALGSPDLIVGDRYEIFELSEEDLNLLIIPVAIPIGGFEPVGEKRHRVLAEFGPDDLLLSLHWEALVDDRSYSGEEVEGAEGVPSEAKGPALAWKVAESWGRSVTVSPSGGRIATSDGIGPDARRTRSLTRVRDGQDGVLLQEIEYGPVGCPLLIPPDGELDPTAFLGDEAHLASLARGGIVCVWNLETQRGVLTLEAGDDEATQLVSARDVPVLASAAANGLVKVWDGRSGREIASVRPCSFPPGCHGNGWSLGLALSNDGRWLATSQYGGRSPLRTNYRGALRLWDASTGREVATIHLPGRGPMFQFQTLALSAETQRLAVNFGDHVQVWRVGETMPGALPDAAATAGMGHVELERVLLLPLAGSPGSLAFSREGGRLVAGNGSVLLWETDTWRQIWRLSAPTPFSTFRGDFANRFAFSGDGHRIVTFRGVWELPGPAQGASIELEWTEGG